MNRVSQKGISLIEIMVVIVLISITVSMVNLSISPDPKTLMLEEANRFASLISQAKEESIISGKLLAIETDSKERTYLFLQIIDKKWLPIENDQLFRIRTWAREIDGSLKIKNNTSIKKSAPDSTQEIPRIIIEPSGYITPFVFKFSAGDKYITVQLDKSGYDVEVINHTIEKNH